MLATEVKVCVRLMVVLVRVVLTLATPLTRFSYVINVNVHNTIIAL